MNEEEYAEGRRLLSLPRRKALRIMRKRLADSQGLPKLDDKNLYALLQVFCRGA